MVAPYPDAAYCSTICGSRCCRMVDVDILEGEQLSPEYWAANHPRLGRKQCGCLDTRGLCTIYHGGRPLMCAIYPYFPYDGGILASLSCPYVTDTVLPACAASHTARDSVFRQITDYLRAVLSPSQIQQLERKLRQCRGTFVLIRGNPD